MKLDNLMGERQTNQKARKRPSDELHYLQNTLQPGSTQKVIYKSSVAPEKRGRELPEIRMILRDKKQK